VSAINWAGWSFILLIVAGCLYLLRLNNDTSKFRLVDLITDSEGRGYSPSLTYVGCFLVGAWLCWYLALTGQYTEAAATFAAMMTGFVAGSVFRGHTASKERTAALNADRPIAEPQPGTVTTTERTEP
jgi:hypothetical protein